MPGMNHTRQRWLEDMRQYLRPGPTDKEIADFQARHNPDRQHRSKPPAASDTRVLMDPLVQDPPTWAMLYAHAEKMRRDGKGNTERATGFRKDLLKSARRFLAGKPLP